MAMIDYRLPSPPLREYVRQLQVIRFDFSKASVMPYKPYWPRPENCLTFYPRDPETIAYPDSIRQQTKPRSVLVGQPTGLTNRFMGRDFMVLQVVFQPGALFRLTGLPIHELTDTFVDAEAVFSSELQRVNERLNSTDDSGEMLTILEEFLHQLIQKTRRDYLPIDRISHLMLNAAHRQPPTPSALNWSVDWLAKEACLSNKQFYRKSMERLGISPKLFDRIIRFNRAARLRSDNPTHDWLRVALESGYYDYQHLARDFRAFTTLNPSAFAQIDGLAVPCAFGDV
jgi:AraC-like DNA-binding protein